MKTSSPRLAVLGRYLEPLFQPGQKALDFGLLVFVEVDHALGQMGQQIMHHIRLARVQRRLRPLHHPGMVTQVIRADGGLRQPFALVGGGSKVDTGERKIAD